MHISTYLGGIVTILLLLFTKYSVLSARSVCVGCVMHIGINTYYGSYDFVDRVALMKIVGSTACEFLYLGKYPQRNINKMKET